MRGLYVHVPYCVKKCSYCDFYSVTGSLDTVDAYVDAVIREAEQYAGMEFQTVYFGGGTPSLLGKQVPELIGKLRDVFDLSSLEEFSIEVNPESATEDFLVSVRDARVNRISIGVQSLNDSELRSVGRIHTASQALDTISLVKRLGFAAISIDLIIGLPGQTWLTLYKTLEKLIYVGVDHVSLYCLAVEEGTPISENLPTDLPSDDTQAEHFLFAGSFLENHGYDHYEISNFALPGFACKHNMIYWHNGEYIGLGPAAASHIDGTRFRNKPDLVKYLEDPSGQKQDVEKLGLHAKIAEDVMVRLRLLNEGVDMGELAAAYSDNEVRFMITRLENMASRGLLDINGSRFTLPRSRVLTSNPIFTEIIGS